MWLVVVARGGHEIERHGLVLRFGLCGMRDLCVRRAVHEGQWSCGRLKAGAGGVHVKCVRCGEGGGRGGSALKSRRRGGRVRASASKSARVCGECERGKGREEEGRRWSHF